MQMAFIVEARISRKFIFQNVHNVRDSISIRATTRKKSDCFHCHILKRFYFSLLLSQKLRWQYNVFFSRSELHSEFQFPSAEERLNFVLNLCVQVHFPIEIHISVFTPSFVINKKNKTTEMLKKYL